ncbi:MAG: competence protein ComEC, partial [Candidatus Omnitrophota bacterium]
VLVALLLCFVCLASFLPLAGNMLSPHIAWLSDILIQCVTVVEQWDVLQWTPTAFSIWPWLIYGFGIIWLIISPMRGRIIRLIALLLIISNCLLLNSVLAHTKPNEFRITFFDVGQGDCTLIEFASGGRLLVDTGKAGFGSGLSVVAPFLRAQGINRIDAIVITHPQYDHAGDISALVEEMHIGAVITNGDDVKADFFERAKMSMTKKQVPLLTLDSDHTIRGFKDVKIEVLHPSSSSHGVLDLNNRSIVLRIITAYGAVLLTGDIEKEAMRRINLSGQSIQASIVKVPHHGAAINQDGQQFLNRSKADMWVIPVGADNRYGHPKQVTWDYLKQTNKPIYRNDYHGAIQFTKKSLKDPWKVVTFAN